MKLRATLERALPVKEGEERLSDNARGLVFRGSYLFPAKIHSTSVTQNYNSTTKDAYPYRFKITRRFSDGVIRESGDRYDSMFYRNREPLDEVVEEMRSPEKLARANRVERILRRAKVTLGGLFLTGLATAGIISAVGNEEPVEVPAGVVVPCAERLMGDELLVPVTGSQTDELQSVGQLVCSLAEQSYLVVLPVEG